MLGGCTIETADQARAFERAMRSNPAAWTPRDLDPAPVEVGEEFELSPCVNPEQHQARFGQPCPRVELWPENERAARLVYAALPAHTRALLPAFVEPLTADMMPAEARDTVLRAMRALQSTPAAQWLEASVREPEA